MIQKKRDLKTILGGEKEEKVWAGILKNVDLTCKTLDTRKFFLLKTGNEGGEKAFVVVGRSEATNRR